MPLPRTDLGEAFDAEVIDTASVKLDDMPDDDRAAYSIARAIQYARDPANAETIQTFADQTAAEYKKVLHRLDDGVTKTSRLLVDLLDDDDETGGLRTQLFDSFLRSVTGIED